MNDLPKHYSLIHEKPDHFMVHDSRDGKAFPISKKGIHPATQMKVLRLPKFAEGGDVEEDPVGNAQIGSQDDPGVMPQAEAQQQLASQQQIPMQAPQSGWVAPMLPPQGMPQASPEMPQTAPDQHPGQTPDTLQQFQNNQGMEERGLMAKGNAEAQAGAENAQTYKDSTDNIKNFLYGSQQAAFNQDAENEKLSQEVANTNIDPQRYMHSLSTGQKIGAAIAMVVGGIGAGLSRGPNLAMQTIQNAINADIDAQKANLGKKQSLLSTNLQKYKDMRLAEQATMMQMNAMTQGQIAATTAKYGGAAGQANAMAALGQLKNKNLQDSMTLKQSLFQQGLMHHLATGDVSQQNPLDYVQWVVPHEKQKDVAEEIGKAQYSSQNEQKMLDLWDKANEEQKFYKTGGGLLREGPAMKELRLMGSPLIHDQMGRVNEFEQHNYEGVLPGNFQFGSTQKELKKGFQDFLENKKSAPLAKTYGIDINRFNSTGPQSQDQIKTVNGVQYKRGPKGEAIRVK